MLLAITPIDGRYADKTAPLAAYFSEQALIRYRLLIEVRYLEALEQAGLIHWEKGEHEALTRLTDAFRPEDAERIKAIERVTNHDVKAVEYLIRETLEARGHRKNLEFVHFGLTSQDINNTAIPLSLKDACAEVLVPAYRGVLDDLYRLARSWEKVPMLARTHGQPASPTLLGKEFMVFVERLNKQLHLLESLPWAAKFGGATGNFNAHRVAFPEVDWPAFADGFCRELGLERSTFTTQIEHYDMLAAHFQAIMRIHTILIDLCRDIWTYISMDYFRQRVVKDEVGSSAMPHKVNPIDFENAEGNLGLANAMAGFLAEKLPVSRLQRDLTDSTVLRNIGLPYAYGLIACLSIRKGLSKLMLREEILQRDLDANWAVLAEAIQTILRRERFPDPYNALKGLTRGQVAVTKASLEAFIDNLDVSEKVKQELRLLRPESYTGMHPEY